ncbi:Homeodomain-interacting protein kinase 2 [Collichthys lucidus]|uniref:Homeodomain-interacting protein kinase 2 n=1 Tax=Collichthys lucidus TaxID=240159 RepID=A0A4V6ATK0_COLLU|nr:Homeodomain-interacting protein kinase 2 [Collichthys lucidus]
MNIPDTNLSLNENKIPVKTVWPNQAAIANLRKEVTLSKNDICASIETRLQTVCTELREELATTKKEIQSSIKTLEAAMAAHKKTIKELERSASLHSDDVTDLQRQLTLMRLLMWKKLDKCSIVQFIDSFTLVDKRPALVFVDVILKDYFYDQRNFKPLHLHEIRSIIQQLGTALHALKSIEVIHSDIKLENIMLVDCEKQPLRVKLVDFRLAFLTYRGKQVAMHQTLYYRHVALAEVEGTGEEEFAGIKEFAGMKEFAGSHQTSCDITSFLACASSECVYCRDKILANKDHLQKKHLRVAVYFLENNQEKTSTQQQRKSNNLTEDTMDNLDSKEEHLTCPQCTAVLSAPKSLKRHIRDVHNIETTPMLCIDIRNRIYVTPKYDHSATVPIHVIINTSTPKIDCEVEKCRKCMQIA